MLRLIQILTFIYGFFSFSSTSGSTDKLGFLISSEHEMWIGPSQKTYRVHVVEAESEPLKDIAGVDDHQNTEDEEHEAAGTHFIDYLKSHDN